MQEIAGHQVEAGTQTLGTELSPDKAPGPEVMAWMVGVVEEAVDVSLALRTPDLEPLE